MEPPYHSNLSVFHLNIRSLRHKIGELEVLLSTIHPDIVVLCEHWLWDVEIPFIKLKDYILATSFCRKTTVGGGVCIFVRPSAVFTKLTVHAAVERCFECAGIELNVSGVVFKILGIYRSPSSDFSLSSKSIVCCDSNIDLLNTTTNSNYFVNLLAKHNLSCTVTEPTRISNVSESLIDNIITDVPSFKSSVHSTDISDHTYQLCFLQVEYARKAESMGFVRSFKEINLNYFNMLLSRCLWERVYTEQSFDEAFNSFYDEFLYYFNICFPLNRLRPTRRREKCWVSGDVIHASQYMKQLYARDKQRNDDEFHRFYLTAKKDYKQYLLYQRRSYYDGIIRNSTNSCRAAWNVINNHLKQEKHVDNKISIETETCTLTDPAGVANYMNSFFAGIGNRNQRASPSYRGTRNNASIFLKPVSSCELSKIVTAQKNLHSAGIDGVPGLVIKSCLSYIELPLLYLLNRSLREGKFPNSLKVSKVVPIFKNKGSKQNAQNYRPIAVQNQLARIFEKIFYDRMSAFLLKCDILSDDQHGFRPGRSTESALITAISHISTNLNAGNITAGLFYDFSKAFDVVSHEVLLHKAGAMGIRGIANEWLSSYLTDRQQVVVLNGGVKSEPKLITCGVPQGSLIGPILFLIAINDLSALFPINTRPLLYADDTNCLLSSASLTDAITLARSTTQIMMDWSSANCLDLNVSKTSLIQFLPRNRSVQESWLVYINRLSIQHLESVEFLGLTIDHKLTWETHCSKITAKLYSIRYLFRSLKQAVSLTTLGLLYYGHVHSRLAYGIICWGSCAHLNDVLLAQKSIVREMVSAGGRESCRPIFRQLGILTAPAVYIFFSCLYVRRNIERYPTHSSVHDHNTRNCTSLYLPYARTATLSNSPLVAPLRLYNGLPQRIIACPSVATFKRSLRSFLVASAYYSVEEYLSDII